MEINSSSHINSISKGNSNSFEFSEGGFSISSNILIKDDINFLLKDLFESKKIKAKLLYSSEYHEKDAKIFHEKCDGIENTLVLIQTDSNRRFGGFTKIAWSSKEGWVEGDGTNFIFSLCKKTKFFNNQRKDCAIYNHNTCFPCFGGGCDIGLLGNCFVNDQSANTVFPFSYGVGEKFDIRGDFYFADNDEFQVLKLEIYKISFD